MKGKIAIEPGLEPVKDYLVRKGYAVDSLGWNEKTAAKLGRYDYVVVNGLDQNLLGTQDTATKAVVVDADGLTPEQVEERLQKGM